MVQVEEGWHELKDGPKLFTKTWLPDTSPTAHLIFIHGFSDHCSAYYNLFPTLASSPYCIAVHSFDQRGWGRSVHTPTQMGLTGPTNIVLEDIRSFILSVASTSKDSVPLFLMGHSMGGAESLHFLLSTEPSYTTPPLPKIHGVILESPYIALHPSSQPLGIVVTVGKLLARLAPNRQMKQKLDATYMSHDAKVRQEWVDDPLCHDTGTLAGLAGMLARGADLVTLSHGHVGHLTSKLPCSMLLCHGDGDRVTSYDASKALFEKLEGEKEFKDYKGAYHKLHAEPDGVGEGFARDVGEWVVKQSAKGVEEGAREYMEGTGEATKVRHMKL